VNTLSAQNSTLQSQVNTLSAQNSTLQSQVNTLTAQNKALQDQVNTLSAQNTAQNQTIASFVNHLFGAKVDVHVAAAARDAAYRSLFQAVSLSQAANKAGVANPRVREAQREYRDGLNAFAASQYQRAVVHFRQSYLLAEQSLGHQTLSSRR
jgi:prophage DNA circulation protein